MLSILWLRQQIRDLTPFIAPTKSNIKHFMFWRLWIQNLPPQCSLPVSCPRMIISSKSSFSFLSPLRAVTACTGRDLVLSLCLVAALVKYVLEWDHGNEKTKGKKTSTHLQKQQKWSELVKCGHTTQKEIGCSWFDFNFFKRFLTALLGA